MKNGKHNSFGVTGLLVAVLAIMAFIRGPLQVWFLAGAFVLWALWMIVPMVATAQKRNARRRQRQKASPPAAKPREFYVPDLSEPAEGVLLRHVNFRISAYLKSAYPNVTWEWQEENPERIISKGGTARIKLFGVPDFNYADVIFDCKANINCDMMKIIPLGEVAGASNAAPVQKPPQQPADPQIWFEMQARQVLEDLIADLYSRGHNSLTIKENGDICIKQADAEVTAKTLKNFPPRNYWQALARVFEKEGMAAAVTDTGLAVTW